MTSCWGFEHQSDAECFRRDLERRLAKFGLALNTEKTRLIRFGRFAAQQRAERGLGRCRRRSTSSASRTICAKTKDGRFAVRRRTIKKRMAAKLKEVKTSLMIRRHMAHRDAGTLARLRRARASRVLLGAGQHPAGDRIPRRGHPTLASSAPAPQPEDPDELATDASPCRSVDPTRPLHPFLAQRAPRRQNPSQEPSALDAHAGICAGGGQQRPSLPRYQPSMYSKIAVRAAARVGHDCR